MKRILEYLVIVLSLTFIIQGTVSALAYPSGQVGQDISWPNCNNLNFQPTSFGIVGVNGGLNFYSNHCIGEEAALYRQNLSLYVNTGFPGSPRDLKYKTSPLNCSSTNQSCLAYNYGYNAGLFATNYALSRGVVSNNWWLDVESINSWLTNSAINRMSLLGEYEAITNSVNPTVLGFYSFPPGWKSLTGDWQTLTPNWVATNSNYKKVAINQCSGYNFTGGTTILTQYIGNQDLDLVC